MEDSVIILYGLVLELPPAYLAKETINIICIPSVTSLESYG